MTARQTADVDRGTALGRLLPLQNGYAPAQVWEDDEAAQTRLSEPTRTWRLASIVDARLVPWASLWTEERDYRRLWALSQVTTRKYQLDEPLPAGDAQPLVDAELARWRSWEREQYRLLLVRPRGGALGTQPRSLQADVVSQSQDREVHANERLADRLNTHGRIDHPMRRLAAQSSASLAIDVLRLLPYAIRIAVRVGESQRSAPY